MKTVWVVLFSVLGLLGVVAEAWGADHHVYITNGMSAKGHFYFLEQGYNHGVDIEKTETRVLPDEFVAQELGKKTKLAAISGENGAECKLHLPKSLDTDLTYKMHQVLLWTLCSKVG